MKHLIKPLLTVLLLLSSIVVCAQDFEVDGIYYNVISEQGKTVEVIKCSKVHNNKLVIPSSVTYEGCTYIVTTIGSFGTIDDCKDITSITIPNSIGSIDNVNFPSIKELIIEDGETALSANYRVIDIDPDDRFIEGITGGFPDSIESLYLGRNLSYTRYVNFGMAQKYEYSPCGRCASLKKIVIGDKVTSIGDNLFDGCRKLEEITIGNSVTSIGQNAFYNCINLKAVYISDLAAWCNIYYKTYVQSPFNGNAEYSYACNPLYYADKLYLNGVLLNANRKFVLPDNITIIRDATFATVRIDSLIIPNNITKIGPRAFLNDSIKYICIEDGSTQLAFEDSGSMIVNNPPNFSSLETLHIGRPVSNCTFYNNPSLKNVKISTSDLSCSFVYCTALANVEFTDNVKTIGVDFMACTNLKNVKIPKSVTEIKTGIFGGCVNLKSITSFIPTCQLFSVVNEYGINVFDGVDMENCILYVPAGAAATYATTDGWKDFKNIVEIKNTYKVTFVVDDKEFVINSISEGDKIIYPEVPQKEGYTFKWDTIINTMPSNDITITGKYVANSYLLTYKIDGNVYASDSIAYGTTITPIAEPTKEGHTFSGWSEIPATMPANDVVIEGTFSINSYTLTYKVDGEIYATDSIKFGATIEPIEAPTKEGHTFSGWSEIPETMPANDVVIEGTFSINSYTVTYKVNGEVYKTETVKYGATITPIEAPTKEGHTFSGWSEIPETMPAKNIVVEGNFTVNSYLLIYKVDGEIYATDSIKYGATIEPIAAPTKEGHTFSGWSKIPETMPANDVVIEGTFSINSYTVTYKVNGEVYKTETIEYGATIVPIAEPTKVGHTFSGWSEIPETMPAKNIVVEGNFTVNSYLLTYKVDGEIYATDSIKYGATIEPIAAPTKEGHTFSGWSEIPETMPAKDIIVEGSFSINTYNITYKVDGEVYETMTVEYGATITPVAEPTKEGHTFSGWSEIPETMPAKNIVVEGNFTVNSYLLTYKVDGEIYATDSIKYGATITPIEEPTKEGHTFSGWSEIPATMPANDVVIEGSFSINSYTVTYKVDGKVYKTETIEYGATIEPIEAPTKEGHTFSGWSEIPETMPANDVIIEGTFSINSYTITFMVDGEVYETMTVEYGAEIELPTPPEKEGYIFTGWIGVPATMPAEDIVIEGRFEVDTTGINAITLNLEKNEVYNLKGLRITENENLTRGIYIVNGRKVLIK